MPPQAILCCRGPVVHIVEDDLALQQALERLFPRDRHGVAGLRLGAGVFCFALA